MKKIIALLLALVMVLSLVACGAKEAPKTEEKKLPQKKTTSSSSATTTATSTTPSL